jgi:hypothetical protein
VLAPCGLSHNVSELIELVGSNRYCIGQQAIEKGYTVEWVHLKEFVEFSTGFSRDSLHVILGVCFQFSLAAAFKIPVSRWLPWYVVLAFAAANELNDLVTEYWNLPARQFGEAAKDIVLTMFIPTLILLAAKYMPRLFQQSTGETSSPAET